MLRILALGLQVSVQRADPSLETESPVLDLSAEPVSKVPEFSKVSKLLFHVAKGSRFRLYDSVRLQAHLVFCFQF